MVVGSIPEHVCTSKRMNERMPGGVYLLIRALSREFKGKKFLSQCVNELLVYTWVVYFYLLNGLWDQRYHHNLYTSSLKSIISVFCMPRVQFAFEFESEWQNGNLATEQMPHCH